MHHLRTSSCSGGSLVADLLFCLCGCHAVVVSVHRCSPRQRPADLLDSDANPAAREHRNGSTLGPWVSAEIGAVAPVSDTFTQERFTVRRPP